MGVQLQTYSTNLLSTFCLEPSTIIDSITKVGSQLPFPLAMKCDLRDESDDNSENQRRRYDGVDVGYFSIPSMYDMLSTPIFLPTGDQLGKTLQQLDQAFTFA